VYPTDQRQDEALCIKGALFQNEANFIILCHLQYLVSIQPVSMIIQISFKPSQMCSYRESTGILFESLNKLLDEVQSDM